MTAYTVYGLIGAAALASVAGDFFLKLASARDVGALSGAFAMGAGLYVVTALGWMIAMRFMPMATVGVAYSAAMLVLIALLGAFVFGERLAARECLGVLCAVAAVALMHKPA